MNYSQAIIHHFGSGVADFYYKADGSFVWSGPGEQPTTEQLEQWEQERLDFLNSTAYIENRKKEYPPIGDQLDYIYHNGIEAWKTDIIKPVKDKYPKPV